MSMGLTQHMCKTSIKSHNKTELVTEPLGNHIDLQTINPLDPNKAKGACF